MLENLKDLIVNYVSVNTEDITENSRFIEDLGFNSYDFMAFLGEIEETFDIAVDEQDILSIKTIQDAMDYIQQVRV